MVGDSPRMIHVSVPQSSSCPRSEDFDHHSAEHAADPAGAFKAIREGVGAVQSAKYGGFTVFTRYDDVVSLRGSCAIL